MDEKRLSLFSLRSFMILLYMVIVGYIPLAIRLRMVDFRAPVETWHRVASRATGEVFAQFRLEVLVITAGLIIIAALLKYYYEYDRRPIGTSYADYPVAVFAFLVLISALVSPYINVAFWGYFDRAEGSFAYLSYLVIFVVAANFIDAELDKKIIFYAAVAAGMAHSVIAMGQFFGSDPLQWEAVQRIFVPSQYKEAIEGMDFRFAYKAYGATYNPNYLGSYMSLIFPMSVVMFLYARGRNMVLFWGIAAAVLFVGFLSPTSIGAFISVGVALLVFLFLTRSQFRLYLKRLAVLALIFVLLAGVSDVLSGYELSSNFRSFYRSLPVTENAHRVEAVEAEKLVTGENDSAIQVFTEEREKLEGVFLEEGTGTVEVERFPYDDFASKRGYIWRKSLGMMGDTVFIGDGLDTYVYNFPHWDPHRPHDLYRVGQLIDKPHNTYIQVALGVGVLGLLIYLYIFWGHLRRYLRVFKIRGVKEERDAIMLALFAGWIGYLVQGLSNDSVLSSAPVFWALFGLSVSYVKNSVLEEKPKKGKDKREVKAEKTPNKGASEKDKKKPGKNSGKKKKK